MKCQDPAILRCNEGSRTMDHSKWQAKSEEEFTRPRSSMSLNKQVYGQRYQPGDASNFSHTSRHEMRTHNEVTQKSNSDWEFESYSLRPLTGVGNQQRQARDMNSAKSTLSAERSVSSENSELNFVDRIQSLVSSFFGAFQVSKESKNSNIPPTKSENAEQKTASPQDRSNTLATDVRYKLVDRQEKSITPTTDVRYKLGQPENAPITDGGLKLVARPERSNTSTMAIEAKSSIPLSNTLTTNVGHKPFSHLESFRTSTMDAGLFNRTESSHTSTTDVEPFSQPQRSCSSTTDVRLKLVSQPGRSNITDTVMEVSRNNCSMGICEHTRKVKMTTQGTQTDQDDISFSETDQHLSLQTDDWDPFYFYKSSITNRWFQTVVQRPKAVELPGKPNEAVIRMINVTTDNYMPEENIVLKYGEKIYYHGTDARSARNILENGIILNKSTRPSDFSRGHAFYVTKDFHRAVEWSEKIANWRGMGNHKAVIAFKIGRNLRKERLHLSLKMDQDTDRILWECIICHFRNGETSPDVANALKRVKFIKGPVSRNAFLRPQELPTPHDFTQLCIRDSEYAKRFGSLENISHVIFFM